MASSRSGRRDVPCLRSDEDHLALKYHPDGLPVSARLSTRFKRKAKRLVDNRKLYPAFKIAQMVAQDIAASALAKRYRAHVIISDGNALLSATGRAANYLRAASDGGHKPAPGAEDLRSRVSYIIEGTPIPPESQRRLPPLQRARAIYRMSCRLGLQGHGCLIFSSSSTYRPKSPSRASLREERRSTAMRIWRISPRRARCTSSLCVRGYRTSRPPIAFHWMTSSRRYNRRAGRNAPTVPPRRSSGGYAGN